MIRASLALAIILAAALSDKALGQQAKNSDREAPAMLVSTADNKEVVQSFFSLMTAGESKKAFELVSDAVQWWVPGGLPFSGTKSKAEYLRIVDGIKAGFPRGLAFKVHSLTGEEDRVAAEVESLGEHANGKTYNNRYHFLFIVRDRTIVAVKEYMDTQHLKDLFSR